MRESSAGSPAIAEPQWSSSIEAELETPFPITSDHRDALDRDGFVHLPKFFSQETLRGVEPHLTRLVDARNAQTKPMEERSTYEKAFLQIMNLWREDPLARRFILNRRCAQAATELLGVDGVRLYHDQALYKEAHGGRTPWHVDQYYWPLATDRTVTVWIPLQDTPLEMGPLAFAPGSHCLSAGRDLEISDESEDAIVRALDRAGIPCSEHPFQLGDVTFHLGWTMHRAGPNGTDRDRRAMTVIYMDAEMRLAEPTNPGQELDRQRWCPGAEVGRVIDTDSNPVLHRRPV